MALTKIKSSNIDGTTQIALANVALSAALTANGSQGTAGQVLTSSGSGNVYWSTATGGGGGGVSLGLMIALS